MEQCARIIFPKAKKILTGYSRFYFKILIKIYVKIKFNKLNMSFGVYQPQPQLCGCDSCNSDEIFTLCSGKETTNSSKPWADLLLNDPVTQDYSEGTPFIMADVNFLETEAENSICSMWNLEPERSLQSHYFGRDATTLPESLSDLVILSFNIIFYIKNNIKNESILFCGI